MNVNREVASRVNLQLDHDLAQTLRISGKRSACRGVPSTPNTKRRRPSTPDNAPPPSSVHRNDLAAEHVHSTV